ncbi:MAG: hypothetical protein QXT64_01250, partial [Desulfurococcaceae archaeon]
TPSATPPPYVGVKTQKSVIAVIAEFINFSLLFTLGNWDYCDYRVSTFLPLYPTPLQKYPPYGGNKFEFSGPSNPIFQRSYCTECCRVW